jgi:hypothetical protein
MLNYELFQEKYLEINVMSDQCSKESIARPNRRSSRAELRDSLNYNFRFLTRQLLFKFTFIKRSKVCLGKVGLGT